MSRRVRHLVPFCTLFLLALPVLAESRSKTLRFDFDHKDGNGIPSPVAEGFLRVFVDTVYSAQTGYGWVGRASLVSRDRGEPDALRRDFHYGQTGEARFSVSLPSGAYQVTVITGDVLAGDHYLTLEAEGEVRFRDLNPRQNELVEAAFGVRVEDGRLDLTFWSSRANWVVNGLLVEPVRTLDGLGQVRLKREGTPDQQAARRKRLMVPSRDVRKLDVVKRSCTGRKAYPWLADYMEVLERFPLLGERGWHEVTTPEGEKLGYFGDEDHEEMGMRAMGNFVFVSALLATDPSYDPIPSGVSRETVMLRAKQCLRYMTRCHLTGDLARPTGKKWGRHWQSAWWTSRMMTGAHLLWKELSSEERRAVEDVVVFEADRHLPRKAPGAERGDTKSEENAWDSEILAWASASFPDHPNAARWEAKGRELMMNALSVAADQRDSRRVGGVPIRDQVYTVNVHPDFTIENHGGYHFCYMACPLHSLTWAWYAYAANGRPAPEALHHHFRDVYQVIRKTFLFDNRFAYLSGNDWPRYLYGEYFILPPLVLLQKLHQDQDARLFERGRFLRLAEEQAHNGDGAFFGKRFTRNIMADRPAEFETDCYAMLGLAYLLHKMKPEPLPPTLMGSFQRSARGAWRSAPSDLVVARTPEAFASMSWRTLAEGSVMGLFIPPGGEDMVEWGLDQLAGRFEIAGSKARLAEAEHREVMLEDGFTSTGLIREGAIGGSHGIDHFVSVTALPGHRLMLLFDRAVARQAVRVTLDEGLRLHVANDLFNENRRVLEGPETHLVVEGYSPGKAETLRSMHTPWLTVDDILGLVLLSAPQPFVLRDAGERNARYSSLLFEVINCPYRTSTHQYAAGDLVRDTAIALVAGGKNETLAFHQASRLLTTPRTSPVRAVLVKRDQGHLLVVANLSSEPAEASLEIPQLDGRPVAFRELSLRAGRARLSLDRLTTKALTE